MCQDIVHKVRWQLADTSCHVIGLCCCVLYTVRISSFKFGCSYSKCELELEHSVLLRILKVSSCHLECISYGTVLYNPSQHVFKFLHTTVMHIAVSDINEVWLLHTHTHTHWKVHDLMCCGLNYQFSMPPHGWDWETLVWYILKFVLFKQNFNFVQSGIWLKWSCFKNGSIKTKSVAVYFGTDCSYWQLQALYCFECKMFLVC